MIRGSAPKMFALKVLPHQQTKCVLGGLESFLSASTSYLNITRGAKNKRPRDSMKNQPKKLIPQTFPKSLLDPLDSIKPSGSNENNTSSKLFKVMFLSTCGLYI